MTELELVEFIKQKQEEGLGDKKIGDLIGLNKDRIKYIRRKYNIKPSDKKVKYTLKEFTELINPYINNSKSLKKLALSVGIKEYELKKYMKIYNIDFNPYITCNNCGVKIEGSFDKGKGNFCSEECYKEFDRLRSKHRYKENNPNYIPRTVISHEDELKLEELIEEKVREGVKVAEISETLNISKSKTYGIIKRKDLTNETKKDKKDAVIGKKVNTWTVKEKHMSNKKYNYDYLCECECGNQKIFDVYRITYENIYCSNCIDELLRHKIDDSLFKIFNTIDKKEIRNIARGKINEYYRD